MNRMNFEDEKKYGDLKYVFAFIAIAYTFSILMRMIWVYQFQGNADFYWNEQLMINTNDGYYFASAVENLLFGTHEANPQISVALQSYPGVIYASALLVKILPVSLETVILYMPAFISSLVVIPIILVSRLFNLQVVGFLAALLGSIAWSYYNRTMVGYYDSDMFAVLLQMFVVYAFISILVEHKFSNIVFLFIVISVYPFFYPQGLSLIYAMYLIYIIYALVEFRDDKITYASIALVALALSPVGLVVKFAGLALVLFVHKSNKVDLKYWQGLALVVFGFFLFNANVFALLYEKIFGYIDRGTEETGLHFFQVIQTVREAGKIPFDVMANRIIGSSVGVIIALIGYALLVIRHKQFIVALPLIAIGVFSLWGGLRFTVYAVPIAAIGSVFLFYVLAQFIPEKRFRYPTIILLTTAMLYPNIQHITEYKVPTVFSKEEVNVLDKLKHIGSEKDYVIAWWDYGYPLWFYTNKNTLIDGGKHHHDNFLVSKVLTASSQKEAAYLARISVETYVASGYQNIANTLFKNAQPDQVNVESFFDELNADKVDVPKATRDVFLYLPYRMTDILPTVKLFSNIDLDTGKKLNNPFFYRSSNAAPKQGMVDFGNGIILELQKGMLHVGNQSVPVSEVVTAEYKKDGKLAVSRQLVHSNGYFVILTLKSYNTVLILDKEMYNSNYIQMFFLENYDKNYFEPVILTPWSKVYRVKS